MAKKATKKEGKLNLESILFNCRLPVRWVVRVCRANPHKEYQ